ncbi:50S ribosomal protein L23 [Aureliella helgolandensis]|uniref:Large ribosomal subunit protein uL23 n=1 Tax=Aureliella helgolandensis TaxID=2527968 RepID=A0A518G208_9BACT|nr:50S ribosomal protein L23 [Aureliella helgolandensis]QDV22643.1 50S ribosomal protein L23 [Aureliella helgolandensis]
MSDKAKKKGIQLEPHQVIIRPLVTEKGVHRAARNNHYAFEIHPQATKIDVRTAVETLFNVVVDKVMTQNRIGKTRRYRHRAGTTSGWKKAIVKLNAEHRIDFF